MTSSLQLRGFAELVQRGGFAQYIFVEDLLWILPLYHVTELQHPVSYLAHESELYVALEKINHHLWDFQGRLLAHPDSLIQTKMKAFRHISLAVQPREHRTFDDFWAGVHYCQAELTPKGCYTWKADEAMAKLHLQELEWDYARFVQACAWLIALHLHA